MTDCAGGIGVTTRSLAPLGPTRRIAKVHRRHRSVLDSRENLVGGFVHNRLRTHRTARRCFLRYVLTEIRCRVNHFVARKWGRYINDYVRGCARPVTVPGVIAQQRYLPVYDRDRNRSFPGNDSMTSATRIAARVFETCIEPCDIGSDSHTSTRGRAIPMGRHSGRSAGTAAGLNNNLFNHLYSWSGARCSQPNTRPAIAGKHRRTPARRSYEHPRNVRR